MSRSPVVGLVAATMLEASPFIRDLALRKWESEPFTVYGNDVIALIVSGIGKVSAATACVHLIHTYRSELVSNVGAAGATDRQCKLGECYHITKVIELDRPNLRTDLPYELTPDVLDGFTMATLATQDRPLRDPAEKGKVAMYAQLVDMEGAAVIHTCRHFRVKCFLFKFVSDTPDHCQSNDIVQNIELYRDGHSRFFKTRTLPRLLSLASRKIGQNEIHNERGRGSSP